MTLRPLLGRTSLSACCWQQPKNSWSSVWCWREIMSCVINVLKNDSLLYFWFSSEESIYIFQATSVLIPINIRVLSASPLSNAREKLSASSVKAISKKTLQNISKPVLQKKLLSYGWRSFRIFRKLCSLKNCGISENYLRKDLNTLYGRFEKRLQQKSLIVK